MSVPTNQHFSILLDGTEQFLTPKYTYNSELNGCIFTETLDVTFFMTNEGFNSNVTKAKEITLRIYRQDGSICEELHFKNIRGYVKTFSGDWGINGDGKIMTVVVRYEIESIAENHFLNT